MAEDALDYKEAPSLAGIENAFNGASSGSVVTSAGLNGSSPNVSVQVLCTAELPAVLTPEEKCVSHVSLIDIP